MRQLAGNLNRGWLAVIGIVALLAGLVGTLATTGALAQLLGTTGLNWGGPALGSPFVGDGAAGLLGTVWAALVIALVGVVLGVLALAWLLAQLPRSNAASTFRLQDDAAAGLTSCDPGVLSDAVEGDVESYPGVNKAAAVLRGTLRAPELTVRVNADDRTDLRALLDAISQQAAANLSQALDTPLAHLAVQVEIDRGKRSTKKITA